MSDTVKIDQHWCLVEDRSKVVPETDPEARFLLWVPGDEVPLEEAKRLGVDVGPVDPPRRKPGRPPASKAATPAENKGTGSGLVYGRAGRSKE